MFGNFVLLLKTFRTPLSFCSVYCCNGPEVGDGFNLVKYVKTCPWIVDALSCYLKLFFKSCYILL